MTWLRAWVWQTAFRRGILGGSRLWMIVAVAGGALRFIRFLGRKGHGGTASLTLRPGEAYSVSAALPRGQRAPR